MRKLEKYQGIFPAFYACYDEAGDVSIERTQRFAEYLIQKGVQGLYLAGSSGECIYQTLPERMRIVESVMEVARGKVTVIAHVAAPSTRESIQLAQHAERFCVDAVAAIPPIYFKLPEYAIGQYWTQIASASDLDFFIYNIPQTTGYALSVPLFREMLENEKVVGVKNSSMPVLDIQQFKAVAGDRAVVLNGPDEQFVAGRLMGAAGGIGGTYGVMPELFLKADQLIRQDRFREAVTVQYLINEIIMEMLSIRGNLYAVMKMILKEQGMDIGGVRGPLPPVSPEEVPKIAAVSAKIQQAITAAAAL